MKPLLTCLAVGAVVAATGFPAQAENNTDVVGRFRINRFEVKGNTLLPQSQVDAVLSPYAGESRDFGDVQKALEALEDAYRQRGYSVVQVVLPEQELNQGVVHFIVVQAKIGKVEINGNRFFSKENVRRSLPALREGETPNMPKLSNNIRAANQNPAKRTNVQLKSAEEDGLVDAVVTVDDSKPWKVGLNADNTGISSTGKTHLGLVYQNANLTGRDDVATLQYTTTAEKPSKVSVYGAGYHLPFYESGDSIDLYASYSDVDSGSVAAGIFNLQVSGKGAVYGGRYNYAFDRIGDYDSRAVIGLDYKAFKNNVLLLGTQLGNDVTVRPVSLGYAGNWSTPAASASLFMTASRNISGGDRGSQADFTRARTGADADYSVLRYGAGYNRTFGGDWQMQFNFSGQYTADALVPGEQFGIGGAGSVRGFTEREIANDKGHLLNAEVYTPNLCGGLNSLGAQCRFLGFYDFGHASRNKALPGELTSSSIASVGIGWRMFIDRYLSLQMDYGHVVKAGGMQAKGDNRLHFLLSLSY